MIVLNGKPIKCQLCDRNATYIVNETRFCERHVPRDTDDDEICFCHDGEPTFRNWCSNKVKIMSVGGPILAVICFVLALIGGYLWFVVHILKIVMASGAPVWVIILLLLMLL